MLFEVITDEVLVCTRYQRDFASWLYNYLVLPPHKHRIRFEYIMSLHIPIPEILTMFTAVLFYGLVELHLSYSFLIQKDDVLHVGYFYSDTNTFELSVTHLYKDSSSIR